MTEISFPLTIAQSNIAAPLTSGRGPRGLTGDPGPAGDASIVLAATAVRDLSGHRVVKVFSGQADYPDRTGDYNARLGVTQGAALEGDAVQVSLAGPLTEPSWSFTPGPVFVGDAGALTQTVPISGPIIRVGSAISATELIVDFTQPIVR